MPATGNPRSESVPRYIPLPDCLQRLHRRFPSVLECVTLECTRCRQWVPVEVLDAIPNEDPTVAVRCGAATPPPPRSPTASTNKSSSGCRDAGVREVASNQKAPTSSSSSSNSWGDYYPAVRADEDGAILFSGLGPSERVRQFLSNGRQENARLAKMAREVDWSNGPRGFAAVMMSARGGITAAAVSESGGGGGSSDGGGSAWHSPRLRANQAQWQEEQQQQQQGAAGGQDGGRRYVSAAEDALQASLLPSSSSTTTTAPKPSKTATGAASSASSPSSPSSLPPGKNDPTQPRFIPNPAVFVCAWQSCQQADLFLDLRAEWLGAIYSATVKGRIIPPVGGGGGASSSSATAKEGKGGSKEKTASGSTTAGNKRVKDKETIAGAAAVSAHLWSQRRALNGALARELDVRRSGRLADRREGGGGRNGNTNINGSPHATTDGSATAYWDALLVAAASDSDDGNKNIDAMMAGGGGFGADRSRAKLSSPTSPTSASARRAIRAQERFTRAATRVLLDDGSRGGGGPSIAHISKNNRPSSPTPTTATTASAITTAEQRILSAFCWVTCDHCGKIRRLCQPFPGGSGGGGNNGAPFVCALAGSLGDGGCAISEAEGIARYTGAEAASEEALAIMSLASSQLPTALASRCDAALHGGGGSGGGQHHTSTAATTTTTTTPAAAGAIFDDPLLQLVYTDAARRAFRYTADFLSVNSNTSNHITGTDGSSNSGGGGGPTSRQHQRQRPYDVAISPECFPALSQLAAAVKRRSTGALVRQMCLTPRAIRAKREAVLRSYLYDDKADEEGVTAAAAAVAAGGEEEEGAKAAEPLGRARPAARGRSKTAALAAAAVESDAGSSSNEDEEDDDEEEEQEEDKVPIAPVKRPCRPSAKAAAAAKKVATTSTATTSKATAKVTTTAARAASREGRRITFNKDRFSVSDVRGAERVDDEHDKKESTKGSGGKPVVLVVEVEEVVPARRGRGRPKGSKNQVPTVPASKRARSDDASTAVAPSVAKRDRSRPTRNTPAAGDDEEDSVLSAPEKIFWVQCDRCNKWRVVPEKISSRVKHWDCSLKPGTTCADMDDEERMNIEGQ